MANTRSWKLHWHVQRKSKNAEKKEKKRAEKLAKEQQKKDKKSAHGEKTGCMSWIRQCFRNVMGKRSSKETLCQVTASSCAPQFMHTTDPRFQVSPSQELEQRRRDIFDDINYDKRQDILEKAEVLMVKCNADFDTRKRSGSISQESIDLYYSDYDKYLNQWLDLHYAEEKAAENIAADVADEYVQHMLNCTVEKLQEESVNAKIEECLDTMVDSGLGDMIKEVVDERSIEDAVERMKRIERAAVDEVIALALQLNEKKVYPLALEEVKRNTPLDEIKDFESWWATLSWQCCVELVEEFETKDMARDYVDRLITESDMKNKEYSNTVVDKKFGDMMIEVIDGQNADEAVKRKETAEVDDLVVYALQSNQKKVYPFAVEEMKKNSSVDEIKDFDTWWANVNWECCLELVEEFETKDMARDYVDRMIAESLSMVA